MTTQPEGGFRRPRHGAIRLDQVHGTPVLGGIDLEAISDLLVRHELDVVGRSESQPRDEAPAEAASSVEDADRFRRM